MSHSYVVHGDPAGDIARAIETFDFTTTLEGRALGEVLVEGTVEGIAERSVNEHRGGEGPVWPENSDEPPSYYRSRKLAKYNTGDTNERTGQMLSITSLKGKTVITDRLIEITYGTGQPPTRSAKSGYISEADKKVTDVEKAGWAEESGRAFFQLDENIKANNFEDFSAALGEHLKKSL